MNLNKVFVLFFGIQGILFSASAVMTFLENVQDRNKLMSKELGDICFKALTCWALFRLFTVMP